MKLKRMELSRTKLKRISAMLDPNIYRFHRAAVTHMLRLTALFATALGCLAQTAGREHLSPLTTSVNNTFREPGASKSADRAPEAITLKDALARTQKIYSQYLSTVTDAQVAREDALQARDAMLPSFSYRQEYLAHKATARRQAAATLPTTVFMYIGYGP